MHLHQVHQRPDLFFTWNYLLLILNQLYTNKNYCELTTGHLKDKNSTPITTTASCFGCSKAPRQKNFRSAEQPIFRSLFVFQRYCGTTHKTTEVTEIITGKSVHLQVGMLRQFSRRNFRDIV